MRLRMARCSGLRGLAVGDSVTARSVGLLDSFARSLARRARRRARELQLKRSYPRQESDRHLDADQPRTTPARFRRSWRGPIDAVAVNDEILAVRSGPARGSPGLLAWCAERVVAVLSQASDRATTAPAGLAVEEENAVVFADCLVLRLQVLVAVQRRPAMGDVGDTIPLAPKPAPVEVTRSRQPPF
jgi:hypothetical protein